jgi:hypothetical protein
MQQSHSVGVTVMKQIKLNVDVPVKDVVAIVKNGKYSGIVFKHADDELVVKYTPFKQLISYFHPDTSLIFSWHGDHLKIISSVVVPKTNTCKHSIGLVGTRTIKVICSSCNGLEAGCKACRGIGHINQWQRNDCTICAPQTECNGVYRINHNAWLENAPKMLGAKVNALKIEMVN